MTGLSTPCVYMPRVDGFRPFIYGLVDPSDMTHVRYVGMAMQARRPYAHATNAAKSVTHSHLFHWIRLLQSNGKEPAVLILEELPENADRRFVGFIETCYVKSLREIGHRLTNVSDGGWGGKTGRTMDGKRHRVSTIEKMKAAWTPERRSAMARWGRENITGIKRSDETRALLSKRAKGNQRAKGAVRSAETRALLRAARLGKPGLKGRMFSDESRARMSASAKARTGRLHSCETREKIRQTNIATSARKRAEALARKGESDV